MKQIFLTIAALLFATQVHAAYLVYSPNGTYVSKSTLYSALTDPDTAGKRIVNTTAGATLSSNVALTGNRTFTCESGGWVDLSNGKTLTGLSESRPEYFGVNTTPGTTNMTTAINNAIQSTNGNVYFQGVTYLCTPTIAVNSIIGSPVYTCFSSKSNMYLKGVAGLTTLKIANGVSSNVAPLFYGFFLSGAAQQNVSVEGITFDLNGQNNLINHSTCASAAMYWGGTLGKCDNFTFNNNVVKNSAGSNPICVAGPLSKNVKITNNQFIDNGWDTDDHTTVLLFADDSEISGNSFTLPTVAVDNQNAMDIHGSHNRVHHNIVTGYVDALGVTQNENFADYHGTEVHDNYFSVARSGVWIARFGSGASYQHYNISVHDNIIEVVEVALSYTPPGTWYIPAAILIYPDLNISNIYIKDNVLSKVGGATHGSYGVVIAPNTSATVSAVFIEGNKMFAFTQGIFASGVSGNGNITDIHILGNTITNSVASTIPVLSAYGISLALASPSQIASANITGNTITGTVGTAIFVGNAINTLVYKNNTLYNNATGYVQSGLTMSYAYQPDSNLSLLAVMPVNFHYPGTSTIFTVPPNQTCILSHAIVVAGASATSSTITIGQSGTPTDFLGTQTLSNLAAANDTVMLMPVPNSTPVKLKSYPGGTVLQIVTSGTSASANSTIYLYGYLN